MPIGPVGAALIGGGLTVAGDLYSDRKDRKASSRRIQTTVADAQAAGINPLTALGSVGHVGAGSSGGHGNGVGSAVSRAFDGILKATQQKTSEEATGQRLQNDNVRLQMEKQRTNSFVRRNATLARLATASDHTEAHKVVPDVPGLIRIHNPLTGANMVVLNPEVAESFEGTVPAGINSVLGAQQLGDVPGFFHVPGPAGGTLRSPSPPLRPSSPVPPYLLDLLKGDY